MSIIDNLAGENIVGISLSENKKRINFIEMCDYYYATSINKIEMQQFILELQTLEAQMVEE